MGVVRHLESVATYPELRAAFNAAQPEVSAFYSGIPLHAGLWNNIKAYAATPEARATSPARAAASCTRPWIPSAATAPIWTRRAKKRLEEIDVELTQITTKFAENVLDSTNAFELVLDQRSATWPDCRRRPSRARAKARSARAWKAGASRCRRPTTSAVMTYLDDAAIRRKIYEAFAVRATKGERDNRPIIVRILELRREKARAAGLRQLRRPGAGRPHGAHRRRAR